MIEQGLRDVAATDGDPLDQSLFQALIIQLKEAELKHLAMLRSQYRMHPSIGSLISKVFYSGELENGELERTSSRAYDWLPARVTWFSTSDERGRQESRRGHSYFNVMEADIALQVLRKFETVLANRRTKLSVGVIAGYLGQVEQINSTIDPANPDRWTALDIEVATVDSFQGRERDVLIYSTVRSNSEQEIGFQRDFRRVNVALSRARDAVVIVGDVSTLEHARTGSSSNPFFGLIEYMRSSNDCRIVSAKGVRLL